MEPILLQFKTQTMSILKSHLGHGHVPVDSTGKNHLPRSLTTKSRKLSAHRSRCYTPLSIYIFMKSNLPCYSVTLTWMFAHPLSVLALNTTEFLASLLIRKACLGNRFSLQWSDLTAGSISLYDTSIPRRMTWHEG